MRLLHSETWELRDFFDAYTPPYAILSHRWGRDGEEISYQEVQLAIKETKNGESVNLSGPGFLKIVKCREEAVKDGYEWVWIDTCCINKESSTELSEAINSMFRWYQQANIYYNYLGDVDHDKDFGLTRKSVKKSKWFTRGWTLQELLAPSKLRFYDRSWVKTGEQGSFGHMISRITGIEVAFLRGSRKLESASVAKKISWLARRQTSRKEDMAYSMFGILDINMPLLYGEGDRAFMRLQLQEERRVDICLGFER